MSMTLLSSIQAPVEQFLKDFRQSYYSVLNSKSEWMTEAIRHLYDVSGKQLRPLFTGLIASQFAEKIPAATVEVAVVLELVHTATLIHDDVIDDSRLRRGMPTLNAVYHNNVSVLMGDYVLTSAFQKAVFLGDMKILGIIAEVGKKLTEGEIRQYETADKRVVDEAAYLDVIMNKTAVLFMACAEVGARSSGASEKEVEQCRKIGELLGCAFQIKDDIFDYYDNNVGKPTGNDIREGKITLPLLHALQICTAEERAEMMILLESEIISQTSIEKLILFAKEQGGIDYAERKMDTMLNEAKSLIMRFADTPRRRALADLADYICRRDK